MTKSDKQLAVVLGALGLGLLYWKYKEKLSALSPALGKFPGSGTGPAVAVKGFWDNLGETLGITDRPLTPREAQILLNTVSNAGLNVTGTVDMPTYNALRAFQRGQGLSETGTLDGETSRSLRYFAAAVSPGLEKMAMLSSANLQALEGLQAASSLAVPTLRAPIDIGAGWVAYGTCTCAKTDLPCIAACGGRPPVTSGGYHTGVQSTEWYNPSQMQSFNPGLYFASY